MDTLSFFHDYLYQQNFAAIVGIDEAGRGACAGPLVIAACVLPRECDKDFLIEEIKDSKKLSPAKREKIFDILQSISIDFSVIALSAGLIDAIGVHRANLLGMRLAAESLPTPPDYALTDGFTVPGLTVPSMGIIRGDSYVSSIAAASILAKVQRDRIMLNYDVIFPEYGFAQHKGYGTKVHQEALVKFGPCRQHRLSYANVKPFIGDYFETVPQTEVNATGLENWTYSRLNPQGGYDDIRLSK